MQHLVFSSDHYRYVKANGNKYYTTKGGGSATVVIPVALNQNNKIIGMTDKMSVAHEIEYTIFIYLAAANGEHLQTEQMFQQAVTRSWMKKHLKSLVWNISQRQSLTMQNISRFIIMIRGLYFLKSI